MPLTSAARSNVHGLAFSRKLRRAARVLVQERLVGVAFFEQVAMNRQRHRQVGARPHLQMHIGLPRHASSRADRSRR